MKKSKNTIRLKRHWRLRKNINGTAERPRLNVFRSLNNIYAQVIDDVDAKTICTASTLDPEFRALGKLGSNKEAAELVGKMVGERAIKAGVTTVTFDRGGRIYHGRVQALADGARSAGLKF